MTEHDVTISEEPRVLDTYAVAYAFILLFLVPGAWAIRALPFRTYSFTYVALVTVPFVLGLLAVFLTDSRESLKTIAVRSAVLTPLILVSGVAVMFTSSLLMWPISPLLKEEHRAVTTPIAALLLVALAVPLVVALIRRWRSPLELRTVIQAAVLLGALVLAGVVAYLSVFDVGRLGEIAKAARKDVVIYIVGALVWYLPSVGISAGVWRRLGLV